MIEITEGGTRLMILFFNFSHSICAA